MKIMTVVGARPNFMKVAPIVAAINRHNERPRILTVNGPGECATIQHFLVHTGQHYDQLMSDSFFKCLNLPAPDYHLGVGPGSQASQTAEIMRKFEGVLLEVRPDILLVVGDVNSTVACALVAAKIAFDAQGSRPVIGHIESGLRSLDRTMPEEVNRVVTDHVGDLLFVTEQSGVDNLLHEGIDPTRIHFVGNTMIDSLLTFRKTAEGSTILEDLGLRCSADQSENRYETIPYVLLTLHRPANVDDPKPLISILDGLDELHDRYTVVFPAHPRTQKRISEFGLQNRFRSSQLQRDARYSEYGCPQAGSSSITLIDPLDYLDFLQLMSNASLVVTDSGGIQEETTFLGVPCVTVRENTERPVTLVAGTNVLAGTKAQGIREAVRQQIAFPRARRIPEKWDGHSADRIVAILSGQIEAKSSLFPESASQTKINYQHQFAF